MFSVPTKVEWCCLSLGHVTEAVRIQDHEPRNAKNKSLESEKGKKKDPVLGPQASETDFGLKRIRENMCHVKKNTILCITVQSSFHMFSSIYSPTTILWMLALPSLVWLSKLLLLHLILSSVAWILQNTTHFSVTGRFSKVRHLKHLAYTMSPSNNPSIDISFFNSIVTSAKTTTPENYVHELES